MFPDEHGEVVEILGEAQRSPYGALLARPVVTTIQHCIVGPSGDNRDAGGTADGYVHADINKIQVLAPPGTKVEEGTVIRVRGEEYVVDFTPFDYSVGRRAVVRRHRPKVLFTASRGEAHDHI